MPERLLKDRLIPCLRNELDVTKAYLARADFGDGTPIGVILGLKASPGARQELVAKIGQIFASIFSDREHLDIIFLTPNTEEGISKVCRPFFSNGRGAQ